MLIRDARLAYVPHGRCIEVYVGMSAMSLLAAMMIGLLLILYMFIPIDDFVDLVGDCALSLRLFILILRLSWEYLL